MIQDGGYESERDFGPHLYGEASGVKDGASSSTKAVATLLQNMLEPARPSAYSFFV